MNLVGKIFTVLIFLMCVVFGTFALMVHAAHKNWREEVVGKGGLNEQLIAAKKQQAELLEQKKALETTLADEKERTRRRLIQLENEKKIVVDERDDKERKLAAREGEARQLAAAIQETTQRIQVLQTAIDGMRTEIKTAMEQRASLQKDLVAKTDELNINVAERQRLEKLGRELAQQVIKLKELLEWNKAVMNKNKLPPTGTVGEVTAVPRPDVVEISLGADDGVMKGHKFVVTRPSTGKYIGMIDVIRVDDPNRAVCRPDKSTQSDQIQKGDRVEAYTKTR